MLVQEIFDSVYPLKWIKFDDGRHAIFTNAAGDKVTVAFVEVTHIHLTGKIWEVSFSVKNSNELTKSGDEFKTFATVMKAIDKFLEKQLVKMAMPVIIIATGEQETNRGGLYSKLMQRVTRKWPQYTLTTPDKFPESVQKLWTNMEFKNEDIVILANLKSLKLGAQRAENENKRNKEFDKKY